VATVVVGVACFPPLLEQPPTRRATATTHTKDFAITTSMTAGEAFEFPNSDTDRRRRAADTGKQC